jgi:HK97 family phage major capsid protein
MVAIEETTGTADPRKTKIVELREKIEDLDTKILQLGNITERTLTPDEEETFEELVLERDTIMPELEKLESRAARIQEIQQRTTREIHGLPEVRKPVEELFDKSVVRMQYREARDGALRILDDKESNYTLNTRQLDALDTAVRKDTDLARRVVVTENEHYRNAFYKMMTKAQPILSGEENQAMLRYEEYRAAAEGATTSGGFAIPVFIDPSVILTDQELDNPFLRLCRIVNINTNAWKGVSAAGVSWSFDAEAAEVSDDSITLAQPTVTVYTARGFIPFSLEIGDDWPGFQNEMGSLLAAGYDDLLLSNFSTGAGTSTPDGILHALVQQTTTETTVTTDGAFGQEDIYKVWKSLGQKYRQRASWMMSVGVMNKIRQFGTSNVYHAQTVSLEAGAVETLFSKQVYENAYFPDFTGTTGSANIAVVGDFSNYVIARRSGMEVELVPHLFHTSNNRPSGSRGWFAHARIGGGVSNLSGFQVLVNT